MSGMPWGEEQNPTPGVKLTFDDFLLFPDDGNRHELIDGEHVVTPSPSSYHQIIVGNLHYALRRYLESHPAAVVFLAPFDVVLSRFDVVEPDLLLIDARRWHDIVTTDNVQGAPDLVIEVASPGTRRRDETVKRRLYERTGVREYWIVDPDVEVLRVYRRADTTFGRPLELSRKAGDVLTTPLLPEFELPLQHIFKLPA